MIATVTTAEPGTLAYILHKNDKDPTEYTYYEVYQDQAAFESHGKTDHMKAFGGKIGALLAGRPEIAILDRSRPQIRKNNPVPLPARNGEGVSVTLMASGKLKVMV